MDTNECIYKLRKLEKDFSSSKPSSERTIANLLDIGRYLKSMKMFDMAETVFNIRDMIKEGSCHLKSASKKISGIVYELLKIKEKQQTMRIREAAARIHFFKESGKKKEKKVQQLSKYDIIFAPTQGGYHYCVVAEIHQNDYVRCFPMTTGTSETLQKVNCRFFEIGDNGNSKIFLTSSSTKIPYFTALNCYVDKVHDINMIESAISNINC